MNQCQKLALPASILFVAMFAHAAVKGSAIHITVLDSETHSVTLDSSGVPKNCDGVNFDAYCLNSKTVAVTNTLLVQEGNQPPFRVTCSVDSKWSRCTPLPKGESFEARREKRGIVVYFVDDVGKMRKQLYTYVAQDAKDKPMAPVAAGETQPSPAPTKIAGPMPAGQTPAGQASPEPVPAGTGQQAVKCSFSSTPSGAEVILDGRYAGSTPSVLNLSTGTHVVVVSLPGFAPWKRELTVSPGSELTVNAVLEKVQ